MLSIHELFLCICSGCPFLSLETSKPFFWFARLVAHPCTIVSAELEPLFGQTAADGCGGTVTRPCKVVLVLRKDVVGAGAGAGVLSYIGM